MAERLPRLRKGKGLHRIPERRERILRERRKKKAEAKPKEDKQIVRVKPLTSEEELVRTRKEINATNRRRAKDMERRVARFLKGNRVPASGALMGMKGDCYIPLLSGGQFIIECKLTSNRVNDYPHFVLSLSWFDKLLRDTKSMNARFGVLVIHYHGMKEDYVFVPHSGLKVIAAKSTHGLTVDIIRNDIKPLDISTINNRKRSVYGLYQKELETYFAVIRGFKAAAFIMPSKDNATGITAWYVFTLSQFRDLLEGV